MRSQGLSEARTGVGAHHLADWLGLAAAPTFAVMALLTAGFGGERMTMICSGGSGAAPLGGMAAMYLLMSAFHAAPWLKRVSWRRRNPQ
jgi:hypothetical protein